jgi:hypothetical protein
MLKKNMLKKIQDRLPDNVYIVDETDYEFSEDEFIGILSWLKYFNNHYEKHKTKKLPEILFPIISKRLRMDLGLYHIKSNVEPFKGFHIIYLSSHGKRLDGKIEKQSIKKIITTWNL